MKCHLQLMDSAFTFLEALPEQIAFDIFSKLDHLGEFPEMSSPLGVRFPHLDGFRQLICKRRIRIIYEYDEFDRTVYILTIKACRQLLPSARDLKRDLSLEE